MTLLELTKAVKINFTQGFIETDGGGTLDYQFEISPKDFLNFSKQDFKLNNKQGSINALTNAKRAIDCQTDKVFSALGLDPNNFPIVIEEYISKSKYSPLRKDLPLRLKFLQSLSFAPAEIIANARNLRHKLEHYYKNPSNEEVSNALELAELFILATNSKLKSMCDFLITDQEKHLKNEGRLWDSIWFTYDYKDNLFDVKAYLGKDKIHEIKIYNNEIEFYFLLKIATSFDYEEDVQNATIDLIEFIGHPTPRKNIKIKVG